MIDQLHESDAKFDFLVQPRTSDVMSAEDSQTKWTEAQAPFHKVATITIQKQVFATPESDGLAENLSFNPWHALPQHRPLGGVTGIRRRVRFGFIAWPVVAEDDIARQIGQRRGL